MWRSRRWRKLTNILEQLPRTSAYAQALATDEELAQEIARLPDSELDRPGEWTRSHRDYTAEVEMLTAVFDRLGELILVSAASRGARGKPASPGPRPANAIEKVRRRLTRERHDNLVARVLKNRRKQTADK